jgi:type II secretory pathway pseudopilin PulG
MKEWSVVGVAGSCKTDRGFVLVEALVAFMILLVGLLAIYSGLSGAMEGTSRASAMTEAVRVARSELERFALVGPEPKVLSGQAGRYSWRRTVESGNTRTGPRDYGYWVSVAVVDQSQKQLLSLSTYKLVRKVAP